jgi:hypothetical protein
VPTDLFSLLLAAAAVFAGALASVTGFGIGSVLTPVLALSVNTKVAVAAVSIPHLAGTALRFWMLRGHVDRRVFWRFGLMSAAGGLTGALLHARANAPVLMILFGALLLFVATSQATGLARHMRFRGPAAWLAGATSGLLGGLVGNQGGIRSAALLGFGLKPETFVATATAIGLVVDAARMPVYFALYPDELAGLAWTVLLATAGVAAGTVAGRHLLARIPERWFQSLLAVILAVLGALMVTRGLMASVHPDVTPSVNNSLERLDPRRIPCTADTCC